MSKKLEKWCKRRNVLERYHNRRLYGGIGKAAKRYERQRRKLSIWQKFCAIVLAIVYFPVQQNNRYGF